jgi:hypothetical protein
MSDYELMWELKEHPTDTAANLGFVMDHLQHELDLFRLDVSNCAIGRHYYADDRKVRWSVSYDTEVMGVGDTLVAAVIQALNRSGHEWA